VASLKVLWNVDVNLVKQRRRDLGLTQLEAAQRSGISHRMWRAIERRDRVETLRRIALVLECPWEDLLISN